MTDFALFDKDLKLSWVKRLCSDELSPWKVIPTSLLSNVGGNLLLRCSYDAKYLKLSNQLSPFYKNLIICWQDFWNVEPHNLKGRRSTKLFRTTNLSK